MGAPLLWLPGGLVLGRVVGAHHGSVPGRVRGMVPAAAAPRIGPSRGDIRVSTLDAPVGSAWFKSACEKRCIWAASLLEQFAVTDTASG